MVKRWTRSARIALRNLAENMEATVEVATKQTVIVIVAGHKLKRRKPVGALGQLAYLAIDIRKRTPEDVALAARFQGTVPLNSGMSAHEEGALMQVVRASREIRA